MMPDGTQIQERDIEDVPSTRRNPIIADIFARLGYMECQGSGLNKIRNTYENAANYQPGMEPAFRSNRAEFTVKMPNLNFKTSKSEALSEVLSEEEKMLLSYFQEKPEATQKMAIEELPLSKRKVQTLTNKLIEKGHLEHVGSKKTGKWIVRDSTMG